jgi:hypothetical protein
MLALVIVSEMRTVWFAIADRQRFIAYLPGTNGPLLPIFVATSALAGINAVLIGLQRRWAVWLNIAIGFWSILLLRLAHAPPANSIIVAIACAVTSVIPFLTWMRDARRREEMQP